MIGATETQLLARYGQPDRRFSYDDRTRLTWLSSDVWRVPGPRGPRSSVVSFPCETSFEIIHGRVFSYDQTGGGC
jgi:hypothetical protein